MGHDTSDESPHITADMTILDVVSRYRETERVFKQYDDKAGVCSAVRLSSIPSRRWQINMAWTSPSS